MSGDLSNKIKDIKLAPNKEKIEESTNECNLCKETHAINIIYPGCNHIFGSKCLLKIIKKKFKEDCFYIPKCPAENCDFKLDPSNFEEIMGEEQFSKYFEKCEKCSIITYASFFIKMINCKHTFCFTCLQKILEKEGKKYKCTISKCHEKLGEEVLKEYEISCNKCLICQENLDLEELIVLKCCKARFCKKDLLLLISSELDNFQIEKTQKPFCIVCRNNLRSHVIEDALGTKNYAQYMLKYQKKYLCGICKKYKFISKFDDLPCEHKVCNNCLQGYIDSELQTNIKRRRIVCPLRKCDKRLTIEIVNNYINEEEEEVKECDKPIKISKIKNSHLPKEKSEEEEQKVSHFEISNNKNDPINKLCYECKSDSYTCVNYDCLHYLCENCFLQKLNPGTGSISEDYIFCKKSDCDKKGVADISSINNLKIDEYWKKKFNTLYQEAQSFPNDSYNSNDKGKIENSSSQNYRNISDNTSYLNKKNVINEKNSEFEHDQYFCMNCNKEKNKKDILSLECFHNYCTFCISNEIQNRFGKTRTKEIIFKCIDNACSKIIPNEILKNFIPENIYKYIDNQSLLINETPNLKNNNTSQNLSKNSDVSDMNKLFMKCEICDGTLKIEDSLTLECDHRFCKNCLVDDWTYKITNGQIDESILKCPKEGCKIKINHFILQYNLSPQVFEKYDKFSLDNMLLNSDLIKKGSKEKTIICPNPRCSKSSYITNEISFFTCDFCKNTFCAKVNCFADWTLHKGKTCDEFKKKNNDTQIKREDIETNQFMEKNYKKCPKCGIYIEKIKNCNLIHCESAKCQRKTNFCYLCLEILSDKSVKNHFINGNPYSKCIKETDETSVFASEKPNIKIIQTTGNFSNNKFNGNQERQILDENRFICPQCKSFENFTKLEPIIKRNGEKIGNFYLCKSFNCKNKCYCDICKNQINYDSISRHSIQETTQNEKKNEELEKEKKEIQKKDNIKHEEKKAIGAIYCENCKNDDIKSFYNITNLENGALCEKCYNYCCFNCHWVFKNLTAAKTHTCNKK